MKKIKASSNPSHSKTKHFQGIKGHRNSLILKCHICFNYNLVPVELEDFFKKFLPTDH